MVQRFTQQFNDYGVIESGAGEYVKYSDYQALFEQVKIGGEWFESSQKIQEFTDALGIVGVAGSEGWESQLLALVAKSKELLELKATQNDIEKSSAAIKPDAWMVPTLVDLEQGVFTSLSTDDQATLCAAIGRHHIIWHPRVFADNNSPVLDHNGVKHYPMPMMIVDGELVDQYAKITTVSESADGNVKVFRRELGKEMAVKIASQFEFDHDISAMVAKGSIADITFSNVEEGSPEHKAFMSALERSEHFDEM